MRGKPVRFVDFRGGVNTNVSPYLIANNEARDARNVVSTTRGSIKKRNGCTTFADTFAGGETEMVSLYPFHEGTSLIATGGTAIYSISTGGTATAITNGTPTTGLKWEFVEAPVKSSQGPLYGMNGTDTPQQWDGDAATTGDWTAASGTLPNGKYCIYFANRVFVAGVSTAEQTLYFSDAGDPRTWPATNFVTLNPEDGEPITGLGTIGPYLLVFKRNKTYVVYDPDTGANRTLSSSIGCPAHRSIAESPHGTYFLSEDGGVYVTTGQSLKLVSDNIRPTLESIVAAERINAAGVFFEDHYYLAICTSGTANNLVLDYDTQIETWWMHDNTVNQFAIFRPSLTDDPVLYAAQAGAAIVDTCYVDDEHQDNAANFTAYWKGPWIAFGEPYRRKRVRQAHLDGKGDLVDVYASVDFTDAQSLLEADVFHSDVEDTNFGGTGVFGVDGIFGSPPTQQEAILYSLGVGRAFSVYIECTSDSEMEVDAITLNYTARQS